MDDLERLLMFETFEEGGRELWDSMADPRDPGDVRALVVEVCRVKDRLDRLHRLATGATREWFRLVRTDIDGELTLAVDSVLREQRQTEIVFKQLLAEIARRRSGYDDSDEDDGEGGLSDL